MEGSTEAGGAVETGHDLDAHRRNWGGEKRVYWERAVQVREVGSGLVAVLAVQSSTKKRPSLS